MLKTWDQVRLPLSLCNSSTCWSTEQSYRSQLHFLSWELFIFIELLLRAQILFWNPELSPPLQTGLCWLTFYSGVPLGGPLIPTAPPRMPGVVHSQKASPTVALPVPNLMGLHCAYVGDGAADNPCLFISRKLSWESGDAVELKASCVHFSPLLIQRTNLHNLNWALEGNTGPKICQKPHILSYFLPCSWWVSW